MPIMRAIGSKIRRRKNEGIDATNGSSSGAAVEFVRRMKCFITLIYSNLE